MIQGTVFDIQTYSLHDGPGIRTLVFLKGCPLQCIWCQNPESQQRQPEILFYTEKCTGCGKCVPVCPSRAIEIRDGKSFTRRALCTGCGACSAACLNESRILAGTTMSAEEVFQEVNKDVPFYDNSGGGVTLSGGDPLAQPEFSAAILQLCKQAGIHTAIETSGLAEWETFKEILRYTDLVLYDFKHMDALAHRKHTGAVNTKILENAKQIHRELAIPMVARIPIIPGCNTDPENIKAVVEFISTELNRSIRVNLLPYHRLGETKYERLEKESRVITINPPTDEQMASLQLIIQDFGLTATIGG